MSNVSVKFPAGDNVRSDAGILLSIPVVVKGELDPGQKAEFLQQLEDAWNKQKTPQEPEILLVPAVG